MSDTKSSLGMFGWGSIAALAAFVASTQLSPQAFDLVRPADRQGLASAPVVDSDISARLWEDPFTALRRYDVEWPKRCELERLSRSVSDDCSAQANSNRRTPVTLLNRLDARALERWSDALVIVGLVPGADFVGGEEARRRIRYATLAGLMAQGYVPDRPERLSLLEFKGVHAELSSPRAAAGSSVEPQPAPHCASSTDGRSSEAVKRSRLSVTVPYEILSQRRGLGDAARANGRYGQVALLWVDESSLPQPKLDALAKMLNMALGLRVRQEAWAKLTPLPAQAAGTAEAGKVPDAPSLAIIGPSSTDSLRTAIADLRRAADRKSPNRGAMEAVACQEPGPQDPDPPGFSGYSLLANATFYSAASTAPAHLIGELQGQPLETFVPQQLRRIVGDTAEPTASVIRTIATDDVLIDSLLDELKLRLPPDKPRRIVVVAERDSLYSQGLIQELRRRLDANKQRQLLLDEVYFFRGLDGAELRDSGDKPAKPAANDPNAKTPELPEGRDQLDYLRRVGQALA